LKALVLTAGLFQQWKIDPVSGYCAETAADHCQRVGAAARVIANAEHASRPLVEECFTAGLLHDIGQLILACNLPAQFATLRAADWDSRLADETEIWGTTHAEIGSYLLGLWGLPHPLVEAIRFHHAPGESTVREFTSLTAVHVADHLVPRAPHDPRPTDDLLDLGYLASLGLADRLPHWRAAVDEFFSSPSPTLCPL